MWENFIYWAIFLGDYIRWFLDFMEFFEGLTKYTPQYNGEYDNYNKNTVLFKEELKVVCFIYM